jgi:hypothetical protein
MVQGWPASLRDGFCGNPGSAEGAFWGCGEEEALCRRKEAAGKCGEGLAMKNIEEGSGAPAWNVRDR